MIAASAPLRIDLAGGTIDIWPLCFALSHPATTVNVAVDLRAEVEVEERDDGFLEVVSEDRGERVRLPVDAITHEELGIATRLAQWFGAGNGLFVRTSCKAPTGSGLGQSSALGIALAGAFAKLRGKTFEVATIQNMETRLLGTPTGYQDYYPALHGGVNTIVAEPDGVQVHRIEGAHEFLGQHLLLADTCIEHHSGLTNWEVLKRFFDGDATVRDAAERINIAAAAMRDAITARDLGAVAAALNDEWAARRTLSSVVTNERIDALGTAAREAGALATKICGAGGGGCMVLVVEDPANENVARAVEESGGRLLEFQPDPIGLQTTSIPHHK